MAHYNLTVPVKYDDNGTGEREWPALLRQLDDVTTDYKY